MGLYEPMAGADRAESSAAARRRCHCCHDDEGHDDDDDDDAGHGPEVFTHRTKKGSYVRLADIVGVKISASASIDAVLEDGVLRRPICGETPETFILEAWLRKQRPEVFGLPRRVRTRPDKALARSERKGEVEKVVKCGLSSHLEEMSLLEPIRKRVRAVSEATNRAGLMALDIIMSCQDRGTPLPDFDQTFFRQLMLDSSKVEGVEETARLFAEFPDPVRYVGDGQLYSSAALSMVTNFKNSIVTPFEARQKRFVRTWCDEDPAARGPAWPIIKAINLWGLDEPLLPDAAAFVAQERRDLGLGDGEGIVDSWLRANTGVVLATYRRWLRYLEDRGAKVFCICPVWDIRAHFIKIDTDALYGLMKSEGLYGGNLDQFKEDAILQFSTVFRTGPLATKKWRFSRMVETDGVSMCAHFRRGKTPAELAAEEIATDARAKSKLESASRKAARERSPERCKAERLAANAAKKAAKEAAKKAEPTIAPPGAAAPVVLDGDLSQDPGVSPNVSYSVHAVNRKLVRRRFTIGRYYTEGGVKRLQRRTAIWLAGVQAQQDRIDEISLKTADHWAVRAHIRRYARVHEELWDEKTKARWARGRLDTYIRKPKALDAYFKQIKEDGPVKRSYYGDASIAPGIKGCRPAPNNLCLRRARMAFACGTTMVDENLTTQCCWKCYARTQPVARMVKGRVRRVRGLVFCDSRTCGCFTNRDFQGARNIMACGIGPRPTLLGRTAGGQRRTDLRFVSEYPRMRSLESPPEANSVYSRQVGHS